MNATQHTPDIERRLRHTLHTVAGTVTEHSHAAGDLPIPARRKRAGRWRIAGIGAVAIPLVVAAGAVVNEGPEYVDAIPPERVVAAGSIDGSRYLLIETDRTGECGEPMTGVELLEEDENLFGSEWNTSGYQYGEYVSKRCNGRREQVVDATRYLENPALFDQSGAQVGDSFVWVYSVHPDVDAVRITAGDYSTDLKVHQVDGGGYAPWEMPTDLGRFTSELIIDGEPVPGSRMERRAPQPM